MTPVEVRHCQKKKKHQEDQNDPDYLPPGDLSKKPVSISFPASSAELVLQEIVMEASRRNISVESTAVLTSKSYESLGTITDESELNILYE